MGNGNPWSQARKQKKKLQREMQAYYEREYLNDDEERENDKDQKS